MVVGCGLEWLVGRDGAARVWLAPRRAHEWLVIVTGLLLLVMVTLLEVAWVAQVFVCSLSVCYFDMCV